MKQESKGGGGGGGRTKLTIVYFFVNYTPCVSFLYDFASINDMVNCCQYIPRFLL